MPRTAGFDPKEFQHRLFWIAIKAQERREPFPTQKELARYMRVSTTTVEKYVSKIMGMRSITVIKAPEKNRIYLKVRYDRAA